MSTRLPTLGAELDALAATVAERQCAPADESYTARLLASGRERCAQKIGEEGVELAIALAGGNQERIRDEAADLLYHLVVGLAAGGVAPATVAKEIRDRRGRSGLAERSPRGSDPDLVS